MPGGGRINFELSRSDVENLLAGFLAGTQCVVLQARIIEIGELPGATRTHVQRAESRGRPWTAWSTKRGPMAAWGDYNLEGSVKLNAYLLFVEWWLVPSGHHSLWCYCYPKRPTEWIIGRSRP
jgi:hypothetical protein